MKIIELRTFLEVANLKSFGKAANSLNYAHSSITAQIKSLEENLGERLFIRDNKKVLITEAGKRLEKYARQIIDLSREAKEAVKDTPLLTGQLTIAAVETISTYRLPEVLSIYRESAPEVHVSFKVMGDQEIYNSVQSGTLDIGFMVEDKVEKKINIRNVETLKLCNEPVSLFTHPDHILVNKKNITATDLAAHFHLLWAMDCCYSTVFNEIIRKSDSYSYMEFSNTETMKQCALSGLGIATVTDITVAKEVQAGELCRLDFEMPKMFNSFMLWNKRYSKYPVQKHFTQVVKKYFQNKTIPMISQNEDLRIPE